MGNLLGVVVNRRRGRLRKRGGKGPGGRAIDNDDMSSSKWSEGLAGLALLAVLSACSPALNWRELRFDGAGLHGNLPCKPERATRSVRLGGQVLDMALAGCEAGGAMWALSFAPWPLGQPVGEGLAQWQRATLDGLAGEPLGAAQAFVPRGALELPQSQRLHVRGAEPGGAALDVQLAWFARASAQGMHLYQAAVYARQPMPEAAQAWLDSLHFE